MFNFLDPLERYSGKISFSYKKKSIKNVCCPNFLGKLTINFHKLHSIKHDIFSVTLSDLGTETATPSRCLKNRIIITNLDFTENPNHEMLQHKYRVKLFQICKDLLLVYTYPKLEKRTLVTDILRVREIAVRFLSLTKRKDHKKCLMA